MRISIALAESDETSDDDDSPSVLPVIPFFKPHSRHSPLIKEVSSLLQNINDISLTSFLFALQDVERILWQPGHTTWVPVTRLPHPHTQCILLKSDIFGRVWMKPSSTVALKKDFSKPTASVLCFEVKICFLLFIGLTPQHVSNK